MAIFRLEAKIFSREKRQRSVVAAAAYRAGTSLWDELRGRTFDYTRKGKGVVQSVILAPEGAPAWAQDAVQLWNTVEKSEKRVDAQMAREFVLAMPKELSSQEQFELAAYWAQKELVNHGMVAEISLHHPKSGKNPHVHILATMRKIDGEKFSAKKSREWNDKAFLENQRVSWAAAVNEALEKAGRDERVDHRSLKDQGIDRLPEPKIGVVATAMKRKGTLFDSERFKRLRKIKLLNEAMPFIRAIQRRGEIQHYGMASGWFDKTTLILFRVREQAGRTVKKVWQRLVDTNRNKEPDREK